MNKHPFYVWVEEILQPIQGMETQAITDLQKSDKKACLSVKKR